MTTAARSDVQSCDLASLTNASVAGENGRPITTPRLTSRSMATLSIERATIPSSSGMLIGVMPSPNVARTRCSS
jgi:hypothetical protein